MNIDVQSKDFLMDKLAVMVQEKKKTASAAANIIVPHCKNKPPSGWKCLPKNHASHTFADLKYRYSTVQIFTEAVITTDETYLSRKYYYYDGMHQYSIFVVQPIYNIKDL